MRIFRVDEAATPVLEADLPTDVRQSFQEELILRQRRLFKNAAELSTHMSQLHDEYRDEINYLVGQTNLEKHGTQYKELLTRFAAIQGKFPRTPKGEKEEEEYKKQLRSDKHNLYHAIGFDTRRAIVIRKKYLKKARETLDRALEPDAEIPAGASTEEPKPTSNPWTWVFPPYSNGWTSIVESAGSRGSRQRTVTTSPTTGELRLWSRQDLFGADDSDWSTVDIMGEVGFWFRMPAAGLVEVWIRYQDINTDYTGQLWDESGCSDADLQQLSRGYLWTSGSTERYSTVVDYRRGESEGSWAVGGPTTPGQILSRQFFSNRSYAANEWVYVAAGVRDFNHFWVDDMSCRSTMLSNWFVNHVVVRSTGAP